MSSTERIRRCYEIAARTLLEESNGTWEGELSSSALSTATAVTALEHVRRKQPERSVEFNPLIEAGLRWLVDHQNEDGGWGDTVISHSNISTTALVHATFHLVVEKPSPEQSTASNRAKKYLDEHGGYAAIRKRYGKDHTFSVPILTQCALAGLVPWKQITALPFELGSLPHSFYLWIQLPVVSYALPALIAIGQAIHYHAPSWNPLIRYIRRKSIAPTLRRLESIQPESGGFLEAAPLTSFVTMSLASMDLADHPVARKGVDFLKASFRPDGSWPIDTNLATWVTTLSVNALKPESLSSSQRDTIATWLLGQQHREVHKYTNAAPGGWAWTNLSGGVPDADDTPGAILALLKLDRSNPETGAALAAAMEWLLNLQNRDGGWPTFCRGWGALPFDRSTADLTAHALRAIHAWANSSHASHDESPRLLSKRVSRAVEKGFQFLSRIQQADGTWRPLWFGNQYASDEENPVYGVSRVLLAYRVWGKWESAEAQRALKWLKTVQNEDGGWGGTAKTPSSVEETALALDSLLSWKSDDDSCQKGLTWLMESVESGRFRNPSAIGLYFAKLWYFERLYPIIFTVSALAKSLPETNHNG